MSSTVAVLGSGSWGSAIAIHLARDGHRVLLWGHNPQHIQTIKQEQQNARYLPGILFPQNIIPTPSLKQCLTEAACVIIAVPSHAFADVLHAIDTPPPGLAWLTKGIDPKSHGLLSQLVIQRFGAHYPIAVISGPSFAMEVANALPTAITVAGNHTPFQNTLRKLLHHHKLRVYLSNDIAGVQLCGAIKNVLAIACGISDGLGYGANAKAALITRGLAEMSRLGIALGAQQETFIGLAGVGDLVLTCTDNQSRNRRFGLLLGQGMSKGDAVHEIGQVVEGTQNAAQIYTLAQQKQVELPICEQVHWLLSGKITAKQAVENLMSRPAKGE
jgi:glycerol-3-phosphate dehydrogenase (NAD(P)+)